MHEATVEVVGQARAAGARADRVGRAEHDVVGEELRAPVKELGQRLLALLGLEGVLLLDGNPRKLLPLLCELLAPLGVLVLELPQLVPRRRPFVLGCGLVWHRSPSSLSPRSYRTWLDRGANMGWCVRAARPSMRART